MITFTIPGKPFAKQRPRMCRTGRVFTPKETVSFEATVRDIALQHFKEPLTGPISITIKAFFEIPKSWSMKKQQAHMNMPHIQRPDLDNCVKAISDGLNRTAFVDDGQIFEIKAVKSWSLCPRTNVEISTYEDLIREREGKS
jgi:Holliday junction resolvase RusA-like endonuclease